MIVVRNPQDRPAPESYHHGVEVSGAVRTLYIAGQIGMDQNGWIPEGVEAQARLVFANMKAVLDEAGMGFSEVVRTTVFLVRPVDRGAFAAVRSEATGGAKNASTLVYVAGLALPELLVEVEAIAVSAAVQ
ncbi:RidA family protein [Amycolatopsis sp. cmx-4-61]|uniref:RidA family protein n=1 Tax=Amycolatopsis sp. cmx-4-61 TaxID=2790937 RepID=UPI00397ADAAD